MLWTSVQGTIGVSVIGLAWLVCPVIEAQNRGLFSSIEGAAAQLDSHPPVSLDATTLRRRVVTMALDRLQRARSSVQSKAASLRSGRRDAGPAPNATLTLNLFEDVVLTGIVERTEPTFSGGYSISGRLVGEPMGTLTVVVNGDTVAGSVRTLDGTYQIRSVGGGHYVISEVEEPPPVCDVLEPEAE